MFPTLCMRKVRAVILVDSETKPAFERADMVLEEIGILVEVNGFKSELPQPFSSVGICT